MTTSEAVQLYRHEKQRHRARVAPLIDAAKLILGPNPRGDYKNYDAEYYAKNKARIDAAKKARRAKAKISLS